MSKYNWPRLRMIYVEGSVSDAGERTFPSMREVGVLEGVPEQRIRERAAKEGWTQERAAFQGRIERDRQERRNKELTQQAVELDTRALTVSKMGLQLIAARVGEVAKSLQKRNQELQRAEAENREPDLYGLDGVDAREMETLSRAAIGWHALAGKALGEVPTQRLELTGRGGGTLSIDHNVRAEITKDDPDRLAALVVAFNRAGLAGLAPQALGPGSAGGTDQEAPGHQANGADQERRASPPG